uniref:CCHC-type domain-containing protein n=1 Tax=Chenopodium quinoa TaxID=63459 RepID=A0A803MWP5_CHEQI
MENNNPPSDNQPNGDNSAQENQPNGNHQHANHHFHNQGRTNQPHHRPRSNIMGILVTPPPNNHILPSINFNRCVIGIFVGPNLPPQTYVQHIINQRWASRGYVRVHQSRVYFLFECFHPTYFDALVRQYSTVFEGRIINLRPYNANLIPQQISFSTSRLWVRVYGSPLEFLTEAWARRIFCHLGYLDELELIANGRLPNRSELRARMIIDITQPLILGCYIPIEGDRVIWVYFRYEGVFRFCKRCGRIGHNISNCNLCAEVGARHLSRRLTVVERDGLRVLHGPLGYPYYTNYIHGLPDTFRYRNWAINLARSEEPEDIPLEEHDRNDTVYFTGSDSSSESEVENAEAGEFIPQNREVRLSPGRRLGLTQDPYAEFMVPNLNNPLPSLSSGYTNHSSYVGNNPKNSVQSEGFSRKCTGRNMSPIFPANQLRSTPAKFRNSTYEVGESSRAVQNREPEANDALPRTMFQALGIKEWAARINRVQAQTTGLLQDITRPDQGVGTPSVARSLFLPNSPSCFGGEFVNLPMTEFDPPNSPVTPISSFNVDALFESVEKVGVKKRARGVELTPLRSCEDNMVRACSYDMGWITRNARVLRFEPGDLPAFYRNVESSINSLKTFQSLGRFSEGEEDPENRQTGSPPGFLRIDLGCEGSIGWDRNEDVIIEIDGSWQKQSGNAGFGWSFLEDGSNFENGGGSYGKTNLAVQAEFKACQLALIWARQKYYEMVKIYTNIDILVHRLKAPIQANIELQWKVKDIRRFGRSFRKCTIWKTWAC